MRLILDRLPFRSAAASLFADENKILQTALDVLHYYNVPVLRSKLSGELKSHADYPSILCLGDVLKQYDIDNLTLQVPREDLHKIDEPFVSFLGLQEELLFVKPDGKGYVQYYSEGRYVRETVNDFAKKYAGVLLAPEPMFEVSKKRSQHGTWLSFRTWQWIFAGFVIILLFALGINAYNGSHLITYILLLVSKSIGVVVTGLLVVQKFDKDNPYVRRLCKSANASGCREILESRAASLFGIISWAEAGMLYFVTTLAYLFLGNVMNYFNSLSLIAMLSVAALPYTVFSVYYQYRVKQWCVLCLTVQVLLWIEFFVALPVLSFQFGPWREISGFVMTAAVVLCAWFLLQPAVKARLQKNSLVRELNKFKHDPELFLTILRSQPEMPHIQDADAIMFGSRDADHSIVMVTNPFCGPCADMHKRIDELLAELPGRLNMVTIFATGTLIGDRVKVAEHMIRLYTTHGNERSLEIFRSWYALPEKNAASWIQQNPSVVNDEGSVQRIMDAHAAFNAEAQIHETPILYMDGNLLPEQYTIDDIRFLLKIL